MIQRKHDHRLAGEPVTLYVCQAWCFDPTQSMVSMPAQQHESTAHPKRKPPRAAKAQMRHSIVPLQAACQRCIFSICASRSSTPAVPDDRKCDCPASAAALQHCAQRPRGQCLGCSSNGSRRSQLTVWCSLRTIRPIKAHAATSNALPGLRSFPWGFTAQPKAGSPTGCSSTSQSVRLKYGLPRCQLWVCSLVASMYVIARQSATRGLNLT